MSHWAGYNQPNAPSGRLGGGDAQWLGWRWRWRQWLCGGGHGFSYQGPKVRWAVAVTVSQNAARSRPWSSARQRRVYATWAGAFGRPRFGTGGRNGASVSASRRSGGAAAAAARSGWGLANVIFPANHMT